VRAVDLPVTAKTRSGWDEGEINAPDVARAIEAGGGQAVAIHARTRAQRHEGAVDWALLAQIKEQVAIPVIGNGGIGDAAHALRMRAATGVDAVMVGRGAIGNPWIFDQIEAAWAGRPVRSVSLEERVGGVALHLRSVAASFARWAKTRSEHDRAEARAVRFVLGHLVRYSVGAPGERPLKKRLNGLQSVDEALQAFAEAWQWTGPLPRPQPLAAAQQGSLALDGSASGPSRTKPAA
jgi:tRNA-dihydrouridine synthase B